tara:strand:- start:83 stop:328 length:246 start_codon:yes stop_codon:yes gene_type:complete
MKKIDRTHLIMGRNKPNKGIDDERRLHKAVERVALMRLYGKMSRAEADKLQNEAKEHLDNLKALREFNRDIKTLGQSVILE